MRKPEKRSWAASLVAVATTAALFFVGWHAVRFGLADYARVQSNQRLVLWEAHRINLSPRNLNAIEAWASVSASLAPEISDTYEILGTVSFIRAARPWRDETERVEDLRRAAAQYREAAERFRVSG
ncbi:MAG TPA: hypothetical protein VM491_08235, partial [Burkholderiaceae bacterium]|nr:hypothetical protein [Burkholderiaceae bacterium]